MNKKILVVVPFFNENKKLIKLIKKFLMLKNKYDILFINDRSNDNSKKFIKKKFFLIHNKRRMGIGFCLKKGLKYSLKKNYDITVFMSGNGKMNPFDLYNMTKPIISGKFDYINGSRFLTNKINNTPKFRFVSIKIFSLIFSILYNKKITDFSCGFRAFKTKKFLKFARLIDNDLFNTYGFEYYLYAKVLNSDIKSREVGVQMKYPTNKNERYTKIKPGLDWIKILLPWFIALVDGKKLLNN
jgi:hypothetical protein